MSQRMGRIQDALRSELAHVIRHEMKDPRVQLATVGHLVVSRDLAHAKVGISVLGDDPDERQEVVDVLDRAKGFIRSTLARRLRLRTVPALSFELDRGAEHSQHISDLLDDIAPPPAEPDDTTTSDDHDSGRHGDPS